MKSTVKMCSVIVAAIGCSSNVVAQKLFIQFMSAFVATKAAEPGMSPGSSTCQREAKRRQMKRK